MTNRELILSRLASTIREIAPGKVYNFPNSFTHAAIETDLGGRVMLRQEPLARLDAFQLPAVVIVADLTAPEEFIVLSKNLRHARLTLTVIGYHQVEDAGDESNSELRARLNALRSDLIIACHAAPHWPAVTSQDSIRARIGSGFTLILMEQWSDPGVDSSKGACVLEYVATYPVNTVQTH